MQNKTCTKCKVSKSTTEFSPKDRGKYGVAAYCKKCARDIVRDRRKKSGDKINARRRELYKSNNHKILNRNAKYHAERYKNDSVFKLRRDISKQIRQALTGYRPYREGSKVYSITGLTGKELQHYLHSTFELNYGMPREWIDLKQVEIDHIIPISTAKSEQDIKRLNHYTNLQLLFREDNLKKRDKILSENKENK
tara:strand:- start:26 stop:610 length:585 start_codon:yes stop_codon:yes gene_type:complete